MAREPAVCAGQAPPASSLCVTTSSRRTTSTWTTPPSASTRRYLSLPSTPCWKPPCEAGSRAKSRSRPAQILTCRRRADLRSLSLQDTRPPAASLRRDACFPSSRNPPGMNYPPGKRCWMTTTSRWKTSASAARHPLRRSLPARGLALRPDLHAQNLQVPNSPTKDLEFAKRLRRRVAAARLPLALSRRPLRLDLLATTATSSTPTRPCTSCTGAFIQTRTPGDATAADTCPPTSTTSTATFSVSPIGELQKPGSRQRAHSLPSSASFRGQTPVRAQPKPASPRFTGESM